MHRIIPRRFDSLNTRMALTAATLVLLPIAYSVYQTFDAYLDTRRAAVQELRKDSDAVAASISVQVDAKVQLDKALDAAMSALRDQDAVLDDLIVRILSEDGDVLAHHEGAAAASATRFDTLYVPIEGHDILLRIDKETHRWQWLNRTLLIGVIVPTVMMALIVAAIWMATEFFVNRYIRALAGIARRMRDGDLQLRPELAAAPRELRDLASALSRMASSVDEREAALRRTIVEKEGLLREIHHRVKNNLQVITSLLNLRIRSAGNQAQRDALEQASLRVQAITLAHRGFYDKSVQQEVAFAPYVEQLVSAAERSHAKTWNGRDVFCKLPQTTVDIDRIIPIGLLVIEMLEHMMAVPGAEDRIVHIDADATPSGRLDRLCVTTDRTCARSECELSLIKRLAVQAQGVATFLEGSDSRCGVVIEFDGPALDERKGRQEGTAGPH